MKTFAEEKYVVYLNVDSGEVEITTIGAWYNLQRSAFGDTFEYLGDWEMPKRQVMFRYSKTISVTSQFYSSRKAFELEYMDTDSEVTFMGFVNAVDGSLEEV